MDNECNQSGAAQSKGGQNPVVNGKPLESRGKHLGVKFPPEPPQYVLEVTNPVGDEFLP